ncbi:hypothetical protein DB346_05875 [Verrucomicrobia bacterium LW23]|nr:hypothetical protein DB346_05875 [Verrucomicrobia bacterium LW23]
MTNANQTLTEFGRSIGIPTLSFTNGVASLSIDAVGTLYLEEEPDGVLLYISRELSFATVPKYRKALALCHYRERLPLQVNAGLRGERELTFSTRLEEAAFTVPQLELAVDVLRGLHDRTEDAAG